MMSHPGTVDTNRVKSSSQSMFGLRRQAKQTTNINSVKADFVPHLDYTNKDIKKQLPLGTTPLNVHPCTLGSNLLSPKSKNKISNLLQLAKNTICSYKVSVKHRQVHLTRMDLPVATFSGSWARPAPRVRSRIRSRPGPRLGAGLSRRVWTLRHLCS